MINVPPAATCSLRRALLVLALLLGVLAVAGPAGPAAPGHPDRISGADRFVRD